MQKYLWLQPDKNTATDNLVIGSGRVKFSWINFK